MLRSVVSRKYINFSGQIVVDGHLREKMKEKKRVTFLVIVI